MPFDYDAFYSKQSANFLDHSIRHSLTAELCRGHVADIGCCMGILSDYYFGEYTGFDFSNVALDKGREVRRKDARLLFHDCSDLSGIEIEKYDTFVLSQFLEHFDNDDKIFSPIFERHKPGARIVITVPNGDRVPDPSHLRAITIPQLRKQFAPHGRVKFYNWVDEKRYILMTCDLGEKNDDLLGLVIPAKNEGKGLEAAILSCIEFVDEIIVSVDDSSIDNTLDIAKRYADIVKTYKWEGSFCKARNFAQAGAKTKWVLQLDGHEYLDYFNIADLATAKDVDGLGISIVLENGFKFNFPRLVRNYVMWKDDVHNTPMLKSRDFFPGCVIMHDRENSQDKDAVAIRDKQRSEMVLSIMTREMKKNPKNARPYFYLGQQYYIQKDFKKAIKSYKKYLKYSKHKGERWLVFYYLAHSSIFLNRYLRALWFLRDADKELSGRWEIQKLRGSVFSIIGKYEQGIRCFVESFTENIGKFSYLPEKRNDAETWDFIGHCFFNLKKFRDAKFAWKRAYLLEKKKPESERSKYRLAILQKMLKY